MSEHPQTDDPVLSLTRAVDAQDWERVQAAVGAHWSWLIMNAPDVLRSALQAMPDRVFVESPRYLAALRYLEHLPVDEAPRAYRYRHTPSAGDPVSLLDTLVDHTSRAAALRSAGRHAAAVSQVDNAREALENADQQEADSLHGALPHLHAQWARVRELVGDSSLALIEYQDAFDLAVVNGDALVQFAAAGSLAWLHAFAGHYADSQKWLGMLPPDDLGAAANKYRTPALLARALLHIDRLEWEAAEAALASVETPEESEYWAPHLYLKARLTGDADGWAVLSEIDVAVASRPAALGATGVNAQYLALARAEIHLGLALPGRAHRALDGVDGEHERFVDLAVARARADLMAGDFTAVERRSRALVEQASATPRALTQALVLSSVASNRLERAGDAAIAAQRALTLISVDDLPHALTIVPRSDLDVLASQTSLAGSDLLARVHEFGRFPARVVAADLSQRERTVLAELVSGATVSQIARRLFVSQNTVKSQLRSSYRKLGARNRAEAEQIIRRFDLLGGVRSRDEG